jgi:hypothetical protein
VLEVAPARSWRKGPGLLAGDRDRALSDADRVPGWPQAHQSRKRCRNRAIRALSYQGRGPFRDHCVARLQPDEALAPLSAAVPVSDP